MTICSEEGLYTEPQFTLIIPLFTDTYWLFICCKHAYLKEIRYILQIEIV